MIALLVHRCKWKETKALMVHLSTSRRNIALSWACVRESSTCGHNNNNKSQEQVAISATTKEKKHNMWYWHTQRTIKLIHRPHRAENERLLVNQKDIYCRARTPLLSPSRNSRRDATAGGEDERDWEWTDQRERWHTFAPHTAWWHRERPLNWRKQMWTPLRRSLWVAQWIQCRQRRAQRMFSSNILCISIEWTITSPVLDAACDTYWASS